MREVGTLTFPTSLVRRASRERRNQRLLTMRMATTIAVLKTHKRVIVLSLIFAYAVFLLINPDEFGRFYALFFGAINVAFIASQVFWIRRVRKLGKRLMLSKRWRWGSGAAGLIIYFSFKSLKPSTHS